MPNKTLSQAKNAKKDEFYTQLSDIERELEHYTEHFKGATILCNCDDPRVSAFFTYFSNKFKLLGLKRLITTCYKSRDSDLFSQNNSEQAIYLDYSGEPTGSLIPTVENIGIQSLVGDGDFRSQECIDLLKQADIVVTNPPFSLFREYIAQLVDYGKKFLIIGNKNAITYKEVFPLIKENKLWVGWTPMSQDLYFRLPTKDAKELVAHKKEGSAYRIINGEIYGRSTSIWYTNLEHGRRHEPLRLVDHYTPEKYPHYDNYNAINVDKTSDIPEDYDGIMGVPITFLDKYCPEQFEIVGCFNHGKDNIYDLAKPTIDGKLTYKRIAIRLRKGYSHAK